MLLQDQHFELCLGNDCRISFCWNTILVQSCRKTIIGLSFSWMLFWSFDLFYLDCRFFWRAPLNELTWKCFCYCTTVCLQCSSLVLATCNLDVILVHPQKNTSQPQHGGNSPQTTSGWDQSDSPSSGGFDYYNQQNSQQQQPVPTSLAPGDHKTSYSSGQTPETAYGMQGFYAETSFAHPHSAQQHYYTYGLDGCGGYAAPSLQPFSPPSNAIELRSA